MVQESDLGLVRRAGAGAGVFCEWLNIPVVSIVTHAEYRQGGAGSEMIHTGPNGEDLGTISQHTRIDYLSLAVLAKVRTSGALARPYLSAGLRRDRMVSIGDGLHRELYKLFEKDVTGASFGAGIEVSLVRSYTTLVEARYDIDLTDPYHGEFLTVRNNSMSLWLGVGF
ncbi:hypothetical protein EG831_11470 [bacterium]|nr:hypothetical protein [bacterium]